MWPVCVAVRPKRDGGVVGGASVTQSSMAARIMRKGALVGGATVAVKLAAMAKEASVAAYFGRGDAVDALLIAYLIPGFLVVLFAASLNAALIPTVIRVRDTRGGVQANQLFCRAVLTTQCGLLVVCAVL